MIVLSAQSFCGVTVIMHLPIRLLMMSWPLWTLLGSLSISSAQLAGNRFYMSGQIATTVALAWAIFMLAPCPKPRNKPVWFAALVCLGAGLYGLDVERSRWLPWWQTNGLQLDVTLLNLDYPLLAISVIALLSPVGMLCSSPLSKWLQGYRDRLRPGNDLHGNARWINWGERQKYFSSQAAASGEWLVVGENCDVDKETDRIGRSPLLLYNIQGNGHAISVGPTGMGKTRGLVSPNLLHWSRSIVGLDLKGDLSSKFGPARRRMGHDVITLDAEATGGNTDSINLLSWLDPKHGIVRDTRTVAGWLAGDEPESESNPAFRGNARDLIQLGLLEIMCNDSIRPEQKTLYHLKQFLDAPDLKDRLENIAKRPDWYTGGAAQGMANGFLGVIKASDTWGGVIFEKNQMTSWLAQPELRDLVSGKPSGTGRTISFDEATNGSTDIFVSLSLEVLESTPELSRLIFGSLLTAILRKARRDPSMEQRFLFLLDEMPRFGYMKILETARDAGRPYIILWPFIQDLSQLTRVYGPDAIRSWMANSDIRTFIAVSDPETAEYVSKWLGSETVEHLLTSQQGGRSSASGQVAANWNTGEAINTQMQGKPLKDLNQVMKFRRGPGNNGTDEQYLFLRGVAPFHCSLPLYDRHPAFAAKLLADDNKDTAFRPS